MARESGDYKALKLALTDTEGLGKSTTGPERLDHRICVYAPYGTACKIDGSIHRGLLRWSDGDALHVQLHESARGDVYQTHVKIGGADPHHDGCIGLYRMVV